MGGGLFYVTEELATGKANMIVSSQMVGATGITIATEGTISISGSNAGFDNPFIDEVLLFSDKTDKTSANVISVAGSDSAGRLRFDPQLEALLADPPEHAPALGRATLAAIEVGSQLDQAEQREKSVAGHRVVVDVAQLAVRCSQIQSAPKVFRQRFENHQGVADVLDSKKVREGCKFCRAIGIITLVSQGHSTRIPMLASTFELELVQLQFPALIQLHPQIQVRRKTVQRVACIHPLLIMQSQTLGTGQLQMVHGQRASQVKSRYAVPTAP